MVDLNLEGIEDDRVGRFDDLQVDRLLACESEGFEIRLKPQLVPVGDDGTGKSVRVGAHLILLFPLLDPRSYRCLRLSEQR